MSEWTMKNMVLKSTSCESIYKILVCIHILSKGGPQPPVWELPTVFKMHTPGPLIKPKYEFLDAWCRNLQIFYKQFLMSQRLRVAGLE